MAKNKKDEGNINLTATDPDQELKQEMEEALDQAEEAIAAQAQPEDALSEGAISEDFAPVPKKNTVKIRLFKDSKRYKDPVFVAVNGKGYTIQRGVVVEVPAAVAEVLENSKAQDDATAEMMERLSDDYKAEATARGV